MARPSRKRVLEDDMGNEQGNNLPKGARIKVPRLSTDPKDIRLFFEPEPKDPAPVATETSKTAAKKTGVKKSTTSKAKQPKERTINARYKGTAKAIATKHEELLKKYRPNGRVIADDFACAMAKFLPDVDAILTEHNSSPHAFNTLMAMADHCYGDLEVSFKASGTPAHEDDFRAMDDKMCEVIKRRLQVEDAGADVVPPLPSADPFEYKGEFSGIRARIAHKSRPNKQEYGQLERARRKDHAKRVENAQRKRKWRRTGLRLRWRI
jgi:hypothetical protein